MNRSVLILIVFCVCFSGRAWADSGFYLGAGIASGHMTACIQSSSSNCSSNSTYTVYSHEAANIRLLGGYAFGRYFAIEAGQSSFGTYDVKNSAGTVGGEMEASAISIAAKGTITLPKGWSVFGKAGLGSTKMRYSAKNPSWLWLVPAEQTSRGLLLGAGGQYDFSEFMAVRLWTEEISFTYGRHSGTVGGTAIAAIFKF